MRRVARTAAVTMAAWALVALAPGAWQGQVQGAEEADRRAAERIRTLRREAEALAARERTLLGDLQQLEIARDLRAAEHDEASRALAAATAEADAAAARLAAMEREALAQVPDVSQRLVDLYKRGRAGTWRLLLGVDDLRAVGRVYRQAAALESIDRRRLAEHARLRAEAEAAHARLVERRSRLDARQRDTAAARDRAATATAALVARVADIDARRDLAARYVGELEHARAALRARLDAAGAGAAATAALPLAPFRGDLDWPAEGRVATPFGRRRDARFRTALTSNGVVMATPAGASVRAIHDGTVVFAEPFPGFGHLVVLDHGHQAYSMYGHLRAADVAAGIRVARGQEIGLAGTEIDGSPALYFELRIDGKPVDPLQWLRTR